LICFAGKPQFGNTDFMDDEDYDDEYGTSQEQYYDAHAANAGRIEGSGGSDEFDG
jgi:hypothetical protein